VNRLDYWKQQAREAEADFYRLNAEQDRLDETVTALVDLIRACREVEKIEGNLPKWL
jgi:hypothetical protein